MSEKLTEWHGGGARAVIEIEAQNHPGVMAHIVGLFARRAFNIESIACCPSSDGSASRIWFLVERDGKVEQMLKHVANLEDVIAVRRRDERRDVFCRLREWLWK
jgi:acetolactate synthase-1/3 small subunit